MTDRPVLGLIETISLISSNSLGKFKARIDTGATKSSIDIQLARKLSLGPIVGTKVVKSAHGNSVRALIHASIIIGGRTIRADFTVADRSHMKYKVLIGQNILKKGFIIDPLKQTV